MALLGVAVDAGVVRGVAVCELSAGAGSACSACDGRDVDSVELVGGVDWFASDDVDIFLLFGLIQVKNAHTLNRLSLKLGNI